MSSIGAFNFLDLTLRLCIVGMALLTSRLLMHLDADVIRSRIYVAFKKLKVYFFMLTFGFILYLFDALITIGSVPGSTGNDGLKGVLLLIFQFLILVFLYHLYVAIKVPDRRIL